MNGDSTLVGVARSQEVFLWGADCFSFCYSVLGMESENGYRKSEKVNDVSAVFVGNDQPLLLKGGMTHFESLSRFFLLMAAIYLFWWIWRSPEFLSRDALDQRWSAWLVQGLYHDSEWILTRIFRLQGMV